MKKETFREGPYKEFFSQGVRVGDVLYLAGQVGVGENGVPGADIVEQWRLTYQNIQVVLAEFGAAIDNVVDETVYVTDVDEVMDNLAALGALRSEVFGGPAEVTQTLVQVASLWDPAWKVEIKCIAHL